MSMFTPGIQLKSRYVLYESLFKFLFTYCRLFIEPVHEKMNRQLYFKM